jgi:hypothetical protein
VIADLQVVRDVPPIPSITTREDLIDALMHAAEIEHAVMCQYLYAAFSIDRTSKKLDPERSELARSFVMKLLTIARQEMAHFGMVTNLLIAIGAPPDLDRPNLPIQPDYFSIDIPFRLLPFGDDFLALAAKIEEPYLGLKRYAPAAEFPSLAALYDRIEDGLVTLGGNPTLFIGAKDPQIVNADFGAGPTQVWYDITLLQVTDLTSARATIELIRAQGEGTTSDRADSHFGWVREMKRIWDCLPDDVRKAMVKPAPANPVTKARGDVDPNETCIELRDPRALAVARLVNRGYEVLLLLLARLYGRCDATAADRDMYRTFAFFPLMTMVVRPCAEILTQLPAGDGVHCAVCTFELDGPIRTFPDREAFHVQLEERLTHIADGFAAAAQLPGMPERCAFVAENVGYIRDRVRAYVQGGTAT